MQLKVRSIEAVGFSGLQPCHHVEWLRLEQVWEVNEWYEPLKKGRMNCNAYHASDVGEKILNPPKNVIGSRDWDMR